MAKILVIDDDKNFVEMMIIRLEPHGYEVVAAYDGKEGLMKAKSELPDLILLDIMIPEVDGYEICHLLKNDEQYSGIPIIICTAMGQQADLEITQKTKAEAFISKPFEHDDLVAKIGELLKNEDSTLKRL